MPHPQPRGLKVIADAKSENKDKINNLPWFSFDMAALILLIIGGANWGVTALRLLTDKNRVCPHDLLQLMRSPWWLQFIVYDLVFIATVYAIIHLFIFRIQKLSFDQIFSENPSFV
jgi:uncharacterized membrane protein YuzA (DUF378 family)